MLWMVSRSVQRGADERYIEVSVVRGADQLTPSKLNDSGAPFADSVSGGAGGASPRTGGT